MIDESLLKSHFIGRDGFRWWIGQVAPQSAQKNQFNGSGWGNRVKVRVMGYHPYSNELPNEDLPWAQVLLSTTAGSGASNYATNHKLRPGDIVFGFFLDGDDAQLPVITGCFGRTDQVPLNEYTSPFVPFTGYNDSIKNDGSKLKRNEENSQKSTAQESPVSLPPKTANAKDKISYSSSIGDKVSLATKKPGSKINKIQTELINAIKFLDDIKSYPNIAQDWIDEQVDKLCDAVSKKIEAITNDIVGGVVNEVYGKTSEALKEGTEKLGEQVKSTTEAATQSVSAGQLAGAQAQEAAIEPVKQFQKLIPCLISSIIKSLSKLISEMVCSFLKNVANVVKCVIDQFIGSLLNSIINLIISGLSAVLGLLSFILSFTSFNLLESIRQAIEGLLGIPFSINCGEDGEDDDTIKEWTIGLGAESPSSFDLEDILGVANTINSIMSNPETLMTELESILGPLDFLNPNISLPDFQGALGSCYAGPPISCSPPVFNIFGGGGFGASAIPIFGALDGLTSSIIGAIVTSGGSGYTYPPYVSIEDNCNLGYGAVAESIIRNGEVVAIIINSEGEEYTTGENPDATISEVVIVNPGVNYDPSDIVTDNLGNEYDVVIDNGSIVNVTPINIKEITDRPIIEVVSNTGYGAILKPIFGFREKEDKIGIGTQFAGKVEQVIDCIL